MYMHISVVNWIFSESIMELLKGVYLEVNIPQNCGRWKYLYESCTETNPSSKAKIIIVLFSFLYAVFSILPICHKKGLCRPTTM